MKSVKEDLAKGLGRSTGPNGGGNIPTKNYDDYQRNAEPERVKGEQK